MPAKEGQAGWQGHGARAPVSVACIRGTDAHPLSPPPPPPATGRHVADAAAAHVR